MRMTATVVIFVFALLMITLAYLSHSLVILHRVAVVDIVQGEAEVLVRGQGDPVRLEAGKLVREGDVVQTGPDSSVELRWVRWAGGMRVKIGPNSRFRVKRARVNRSTKEEESRLQVDTGKIWVRLREALRGRSKFEVETPTVVAAVRGTIFSVEVRGDGSCRIEVYEGRVEAKGEAGAAAILTGGSETTIAKGQRSSASRPLSDEQMARWERQASIVGPFLEVESPAEGELAEGSSVGVAGRVEPGSKVYLNGEEATVSEAGEFSGEAPLAAGQSQVEVRARGAEGRETTVVRTLSRPWEEGE